VETLNLSDRSWKRSSNKQTAQQAIEQLQVAEPKRETSLPARTDAVEQRLAEVSFAVEALEGRVEALVEDFRGRIEGTLQAFQGKSARQAKDLEKITHLLEERFTQQFQQEVEIALVRLQEERKHSWEIVEDGKQQLANLAEAKLATLSQSSREEYARLLAAAFREHSRAVHEPAKVEVESIKQTAERALAQIQAAEPKSETGTVAQVDTAEERLRGVSAAVEALEGRVGTLVEDFQRRLEDTLAASQGKGSAPLAEDLEKIAQGLGGRWSQQFQEQAEAALERLREELKNSRLVAEESKRELTNLVEAKLASLGQAAREDVGQQLAQALREHAQVMHEPSNEEVESVKLAAEQAIMQLRVAEERREAGFAAQADAAEERLRGVLAAVEALQGRMGTLVEDFQRRSESMPAASQERGSTGLAEDLEKIAQDLVGRWSQQFQEQAEATVERLRDAEEKRETGFAAQAEAAEGRLRGVSLAVDALEGRVGALAEALQGKGARQAEDLEKIAQDLVGRWSQQFQERAEAAVVRLRDAEEKRETGFATQAEAAEGRLRGVSLAVDALEGRVGALAEALQGKGARQAEDLEKIAQDLVGRWSQQFQERAEAAVVRLRDAEEKRETGFATQAEAAEERLRGVSSTVEAVEGRVGALVKDFQERIEGTLRAFQWKGARQAEDLEKIAQDLGGRWVQQLKEQAEAALERLRVAEEKRETGLMAQAEAAEERLRAVSLAVEALGGSVGALAEDFQGRMESTLQAFQWKGARQAEDLEKIAQDVGGRWSQHFREQAEAAAEKLREELKNSGRVVEEGKQQLAGLAEATLASLSQATREEFGQRLEQTFGEHAQAMREAANVEVESIKQAAQQAIAQLQVAGEKRETGFAAQAEAAEERLRGVSSSVEALGGRVGTLVEDFQGRMESTLQAFQWKGARQAEDLEKIAQDVGGRLTQQFQEQAKAAVKRLREELKNSGRVVEEGKEQLASLAETTLASLSQAVREEYGQQLAQALGQHQQVMHEAANVEVESIKQAAEQAIAQLHVAEEKKETGFAAQADAAEERLKGVSSAVEALGGRVEALVEDFRGRIEAGLQVFQVKGTRQAEDLERITRDLGDRWTQQFREQAEAALRRLQDELKSSGRAVEENKQQLASLAKAKMAVISQVADNAVAALGAEERRLKVQYETSRKELEGRIEEVWTKPPAPPFVHQELPKRRGVVARLALATGVCLITMVPLLGVYLSTRPVMHLQSEVPADFVEQSPSWSAKRRAREKDVAQGYWRVALASLEERYPFGSELPAEPPDEFQVENKSVPPVSPKALAESRAHYWEKLRRIWVDRQSWEEHHEWNTQWTTRLRHIWDRLALLK
jgi:hypothetical protein